MQTFAEQLNAVRKEKGLTQEQLAVELNVSRTTISRWESGRALPDIETIKRLSQVLNVNFFTVEGLTEEAPAPAEETPAPAEEAPQPRPRKKRWIAVICASVLLVICLAAGLVLLEKGKTARIVAASDKPGAYLETLSDGGFGWRATFSFENTGDAAFKPDGVDIIYFEHEEPNMTIQLPYADLGDFMPGEKLTRGGGAMQVPIQANMFSLTHVTCRIYGKDDNGHTVDETAVVQFINRMEKTSAIVSEDPNAACIVATSDKEVAYLEPFFDDGFGWYVNFYFENISNVTFKPDGVETLICAGDTVTMTFFRPYEELMPHMSNGMLYKGGIPLHYPVGVSLLDTTHVICRIYGTDANGNPVDVSKTVPLSQEYRK